MFFYEFLLFYLAFVCIVTRLIGKFEGIRRDPIRVEFLFGGVSPLNFMRQTCSWFFIFFFDRHSLFGLLFAIHKWRFFLCVVLSIKFFVIVFNGSNRGDSFSVCWIGFFLCLLITFPLYLISCLLCFILLFFNLNNGSGRIFLFALFSIYQIRFTDWILFLVARLFLQLYARLFCIIP